MSKELDENGNPIVKTVDGDPKPDGKEEVIPKKEFDILLKESLKRKDAVAALEKEKQKLAEQLEAVKTNELKSKQMWKELAETNEKKVQQLESELTQTKQERINSAKYSALRAACLKLGLHPHGEKYLENTPLLGELEIETTSMGRINVLNADLVAQSFKAQNLILFQTPKAQDINTDTPTVLNGGNGGVTLDEVNKLSKKYSQTKDPKDLQLYNAAVLALKSQPRA